ncbi:MAG: DUF4270 family protein [Cyclobacteriaceae bacterium]|nr:DUF4270 family protein [Cyclobacteriaceae bacterium]
MNLRDSILGLLTVATLFFLFACEEPGEIGIGIDPNNTNIRPSYIEIPLELSVTKAEPFIVRDTSFFSNYFPIAQLENESFGKTRVKNFTRIYPRDSLFRFREGMVVDSLVLNLSVDRIYGSGTNLLQHLSVHEITESFEPGRIYVSNEKLAYNPTPLGEYSFIPNVARFDTARRFEIRFPIDKSITDRFIEEAKNDSTGAFIIPDKFPDFFPGLAVIPGENNSTFFDINIRYDGPVFTSFLSMFYRTATDTARYDFLFFNILYNIERDFSGSDLEFLAEENQFYPSEKAYVKAGTGVLTQIDFQPVLDYFDTIPRKVINNASFEIIADSSTRFLRPPASLFVYSLQPPFDMRRLSQESAYMARNVFSYRMQFSLSPRPEEADENLPLPGRYQVVNIQGNQTSPVALSEYIQNLITRGNQPTKWLLVPADYGNSFNQFTAKKENVKVKIYYTTLR